MKRTVFCLITLGMLLVVPSGAGAQPGDLDRSFGNQGIAVAPSAGSSSRAFDVAVGNDGRIVVAGEDGVGPLLAGLRPNGLPDMDFGDSGLVRKVPWECDSCIQPTLSVLRQGTGFLVAGVNQGRGVVARLDADGGIDETWASGFVFVRGFGVVWNIAKTPEGKIMLVTSDEIVRLQPTGEIDHSFGKSGRVNLGDLRAGGRRLAANQIDVANDGSVYVAGSAYRGKLAQQVFVAKLRKTGEFDESFGNGSAVIRPQLGYSTDLDVSAKGLYVAATLMSRRGSPHSERAAILKFSLDGKPRSRYGRSGAASHSDGSFSSSIIVTRRHVIAQTKLAAKKRGGNPPLRISRFNHRGKLDRSFGHDGRTKVRGISLGGMVLDSQARVVVAGSRGMSNRRIAVVARLKGE